MAIRNWRKQWSESTCQTSLCSCVEHANKCRQRPTQFYNLANRSKVSLSLKVEILQLQTIHSITSSLLYYVTYHLYFSFNITIILDYDINLIKDFPLKACSVFSSNTDHWSYLFQLLLFFVNVRFFPLPYIKSF